MSDTVNLFSAQSQLVLKTLDNQKHYYVKESYVKEKYGLSAQSMLIAYKWLAKNLSSKVSKPTEAQLPVWHSKNPAYAKVDMDQTLLELKIPSKQVLLFDNKGWERILNLDYVGLDEKDQKAYADYLSKMGLDCGYRAFEKAFYPHIRREIENSWKRIFHLKDTSIVRGATWLIDSDWII